MLREVPGTGPRMGDRSGEDRDRAGPPPACSPTWWLTRISRRAVCWAPAIQADLVWRLNPPGPDSWPLKMSSFKNVPWVVSNLVVSVLLEWAELSPCVSSCRFILLPLMAVQRYLCHYLFDNSFSGEHLACFVFFFYKKCCYSTLKCSQVYFLWKKYIVIVHFEKIVKSQEPHVCSQAWWFTSLILVLRRWKRWL